MTLRMLLLALAAALATGCSTLDKINPFASSSHKLPELPPVKAGVDAATAWTQGVGKAGDYVFTPAVVGGVVYAAGTKGDVYRIENGEVKWKINAGVELSGGVGADNRRVVVGSSKGDVIAFNSADGALLWKARVSSDVLAPPAVDGDLVVVRSGDHRLTAFEAADGKRRWIYQRATPSLAVRSFAAPLIDNNYVFAGFPGGKLVAVTTNNGAQAWEGTVALPKGTTELDRIADVNSSPVISGHTVCSVAYQGRVACFDLTNGQLAWARDISSAAGLTVDGRNVYVSDDKGAVHALDLSSGASHWKQDKLAQRDPSAPVAVGRYVAVGDVQGVVHVLSRDDGAFVARVATDGSPIRAALQKVGDKILVQTRDGRVQAIEVR